MNIENKIDQIPKKESALKVIVHSFFVVPFIIAIFAVLIFLVTRIMTAEPNTAQDYLEDVKIGGATKRWQGAFELSKILSNPKMVPKDDRFVTEMINTFEYAINDRDIRIRQFLAIAMGATGDKRYVETIIKALDQNDSEIIMACAFALGNLKDTRAVEYLLDLLESGDSLVRLQSVIALGKIDDSRSIMALEKMLADIEPNVRWDAAVALAKQKNSSGRRIILDLLDRKYLNSFSNIDKVEQVQAMMVAINVAPLIKDSDLKASLLDLRESDSNLKIREAARRALLNFEE
jgi:hypothetical protein